MLRTTTTRLLAAGCLAAALAAAGCSADDSDDNSTTAADDSTTPLTDDSTGADSAADLEAFCQGVVDYDATPKPTGGENEEPSAEDVAAYGQALAEPVQAIVDNAPDAVEAIGAIETAVADECGHTAVTVTAVDDNFEGVPAELEAGLATFVVPNRTTADEEHVMLVARVVDGETLTPEQFVADPEGSFAKIEVVGETYAPAGATGGVTLDLAAGDYLLICPVSHDETSPPHFVLGMISAVTVA